MCTVQISRNERELTVTLTADGHAGYAESGKDIVCAGISTLIQTFACTVQILSNNENLRNCEMDLNEGNTRIFCRCDTEEQYTIVLMALGVIKTGLDLIAETYPACLQVKSV